MLLFEYLLLAGQFAGPYYLRIKKKKMKKGATAKFELV